MKKQLHKERSPCLYKNINGVLKIQKILTVWIEGMAVLEKERNLNRCLYMSSKALLQCIAAD